MPEPRGPLPPDVAKAARLVSPVYWGQRYAPGGGPMHWAGGPYWGNHLRQEANRLERLAAAARVCADYLGDGSFPTPESTHKAD